MTKYILPSNTLTFYALSRKIKVFTDKKESWYSSAGEEKGSSNIRRSLL